MMTVILPVRHPTTLSCITDNQLANGHPEILPCPVRPLAGVVRWMATRHPRRQFGLWRVLDAIGRSSPALRRCTLQGPDGEAFDVDLTEGGFHFMINGFGTAEVSRIIARLPSEGNCIDVGAHWGIWSRMLARQCPRGAVYAFEPSPSTFQLLRHNTGALDNVECLNDAMGSVSGTVFFSSTAQTSSLRCIQAQSVDDGLRKSGKVCVNCTTLVSFIKTRRLQRLDFLKVDVEGFEGDVILPALDELRQFGTAIYFEHIPEFANERSVFKGNILFEELNRWWHVYRSDLFGEWRPGHVNLGRMSCNYLALPK
jgi:FkbM family methyltransferase